MIAKNSLKKLLLAAAAASMALSAAAPAMARGGHGHGAYAYGGHGHYRGHRAAPRYYYGSRHYRRGHRRGGLSGGETALLAAGIIGGVILIDRAIENDRARSRYAGDPYYGAPPRRADDSYYRRDDRALSYEGRYDDGYAGGYNDYDDGYDYEDGADIDGALLGEDAPQDYDAPRDYAAAPPASSGRSYNYGAAYNDCKSETRAAAGDAGLLIALPARPTRIQEIDGGAAVRFTANYTAQDGRGGEWRRVMTCEADEGGVRFLELA